MYIEARVSVLLGILVGATCIGAAIGYAAPIIPYSPSPIPTEFQATGDTANTKENVLGSIEDSSLIVNDKDILQKMVGSIGYSTSHSLRITDKSGKTVLDVSNFMTKNTDLDQLLSEGQYKLIVLDKSGNEITKRNLSIQ